MCFICMCKYVYSMVNDLISKILIYDMFCLHVVCFGAILIIYYELITSFWFNIMFSAKILQLQNTPSDDSKCMFLRIVIIHVLIG